jgi:hypothetical protein
MTKISSKAVYPIKTPVKSDYFVGSNSENFGQTVNFGFEETAKLVNDLNGTSIVNYLYDTSPYISTEVLVEGKFLSLASQTDTSLLTKLYVNKFNHSGDNLGELYLFLMANATDFYLKIRNSNNQNNAVYFDIASIEDFTDYFIFNIAVFKENEFLPALENLNVYFFNFELKAISAGTSDPLKLDKSTYVGNAKNLDDRIIVLENLQDLQTNFTGQAFAVWTGVGFVYDVIYPDYYIQGVLYTGATEQITLDASDVTHPRLDVIAVDTTGAIKVTGTADTNPVVPTIDNETTIQITTVLVSANAITPTVTEQYVYKENVEWATTSNIGSLVFNATASPFQGTTHIDCNGFIGGQYIRFTDNTTNQITDYNNLKFYLNLKGAFATNTRLSIRFFNGATLVSSTLQIASGSYNFSRTLTNSYQTISIPLTAFTFSGSTFDRIEIATVGTSLLGFRMDNMALYKDDFVASPAQKAITSIVTNSGILNATTADDTVSIIGANGCVVSAVGKVITITPAAGTNYVSQTITDGVTITSPSENVVFDALALKVDKDGTKVLSDNNYTTSEKNKLSSIDATHYLAPLQTTVQLSALPQASISDKARVYVETELSDYFYDTTASSGDIAPDDQTGGIGFWRKVAVGGETAASIKTKYESNPDTNAFTDSEKAIVATVSGKEDTSNKSQDIETDKLSTTKYGSVKAFYDWAVAKFQLALVSGTNIKTINGTSLLGSGDIEISGGGGLALTVRKISTNTTLAESDNGTVILLTGSCTVTLPNGLSLGFNCSFVTATGATMTYALGGSIVLINNNATTMAEKLSHTITNTGVSNEYLTVGL